MLCQCWLSKQGGGASVKYHIRKDRPTRDEREAKEFSLDDLAHQACSDKIRILQNTLTFQPAAQFTAQRHKQVF